MERIDIEWAKEMNAKKLGLYIIEITQTEICKDAKYCNELLDVFRAKNDLLPCSVCGLEPDLIEIEVHESSNHYIYQCKKCTDIYGENAGGFQTFSWDAAWKSANEWNNIVETINN